MPAVAPRSRRRRLEAACIILAVLIAIVVVRLVTLTPAPVTLQSARTTTVRLTGMAPVPAWPASGQAALTIEGVGSLGASGTGAPVPIASVTKVMTAYLTLERYPLTGSSGGFDLTVTPSDARAVQADTAQDESVVPVAAGEQLDERQLLEALLIRSGDNIAQILAARVAGSVPRFVAEMNREARLLGMAHTTYTDPSGYAPTTVSTAADQVRVFARAIQLATFRQIVAMPSVTLPVAGTAENYDPLIAAGYEGKTGSDSAAEGCLAFFTYLRVAGRRLTAVGVVLGQGMGDDTAVILGAAGAAAERLVASVRPAVRVHTVLPVGSAVLRATSADGHTASGVTTRALMVIGWGGQPVGVTIRPQRAGISLRAGQRLGQVALSTSLSTPAGAGRLTTVSAASALPTPGLSWRLGHLL